MMPSDKLDVVRLLCETSGAEGLPQYAVISLTAAKIRSILSQHAAFMALKIVLSEAEMLRLLNCGDVAYYDAVRELPTKSAIELADYRIRLEKPELFELDFTPISNNVSLPKKQAKMGTEYLCLYSHCVCWLGVCKHVDGEVETRTIAISDLKALLKGLK